MFNLLYHDTPPVAGDFTFQVHNGFSVASGVLHYNEIPEGLGDVFFERMDDKLFRLYLISDDHTSIIDNCTHEFLYFLNKTINPEFDEAFNEILYGSKPHK